MKKIIIFSLVCILNVTFLMASTSSSLIYDDSCIEAFYETDTNGDGCLDIDEFLTLGGATTSLFYSTDTNADGCINLWEFLDADFICTRS